MSSRTSADWNSETYQGTRRGRQDSGDIGWEMFPEKLETTPLDEDPEQLDVDRRQTLMDFSPDTASMFAYEEPRRNVMSRSHLNLRDGGVFGSTTDPYKSEDYDTQFHDKDPRGYSDQQPWGEYRRQIESQMRRFDFRDDGDYSTTGGGIHPNTMYKQIRGAQNWVKARLKIFDTSFDNMHSGGVGTYDHVSNVFKSSQEDSSVSTDGSGMARTFEDPENRQRLTMHLSNIVHGGSPMLRTNETTDHKVPVAGYGMLYKQRGLIPHETQMRMIQSDTPRSRLEGASTVPKNLVKLMATALEDQSMSDPGTAAASARLMYQDAALEGHGQEVFKGMRGGEAQGDNRSLMLTRDIMALLGFVEQDVKFLESQKGRNRKPADHALADLWSMGSVVHALPANIKLEIRNELILRSAGFGLAPARDPRQIQNQVVVNPKILRFMDLMVRRSVTPGDPAENREGALGDSEQKLNRSTAPLFLTKSALRSSEDLAASQRGAVPETAKNRSSDRHEGLTASYRHLARGAENIASNNRQQSGGQFLVDTLLNHRGKTANLPKIYEQMTKTELDTQFGENRGLVRHMGRIGTKNMRQYVDTDYFSRDKVNEQLSYAGAAPKNARYLPKSPYADQT